MKRRPLGEVAEKPPSVHNSRTIDGLVRRSNTYLCEHCGDHRPCGPRTPTSPPISPASLLSGSKVRGEWYLPASFEAEFFFDWVSPHVPGGGSRSSARLAKKGGAVFKWDKVGGDVLKVLYESVISGSDKGKKLGELLHPRLARRAEWWRPRSITRLITRVLEPVHAALGPSSSTRCGGTWRRSLGPRVFRFIRRRWAGLTHHVLGMGPAPGGP